MTTEGLENLTPESIQGFLQHIPRPAVLADRQGEILAANPLALALQHPDTDSPSPPTIFVIAPGLKKNAWQALWKQAAEGAAARLEVSPVPQAHQTAPLGSLTLDASALPWGRKKAVLCLIQDNSDSDAQIHDLENQLNSFRSMVNFSRDLLVWKDQNGNPMFISPAIEDITGYTIQEIKQDINVFSKHVFREEMKTVWDEWYNMGNTSPAPLQIAINHKDGSQRWVECTCTPIYSAEKTPQGSITSVRDITYRIAVDEKIRTNEYLFNRASILNHMGSFFWDLATNEIFWSENMYRIHGLSPEGDYGNLGTYETTQIHPDDIQYVMDTSRTMLESGKNWELKYRITRPDTGEERVLLASAEVERDQDGKAILITGFHQDITEQERLQRELRLANADLTQAQRLAGLGSWYWKFTTGEIYWSEHMYEITGMDHSLPLPDDEQISPQVLPEYREEFLAKFRKIQENGAPFSIDFRFRRFNDSMVRDLHMETAFLWDRDDNLSYIFGTIQDITDQKEIERQLEESRQNLMRAQRIARLGTWQLDLQDGASIWSDTMYSIMGRDPTEGIPHSSVWAENIHPADIQNIRVNMHETVIKGEPFQADFRFIRYDNGEISYLHVEAEGNIDKNGNVIGLLGTVQDLTELRKAEITARELLHQSREMLEKLKLLAVSVDINDRILYCNPFFLNLVGWEMEEIRGKTWSEVFLPDEEQKKIWEQFWNIVRQGDFQFHNEFDISTRDGRKRKIFWNRTPIRNEDGNLIGITSIGEDITERYHAEQALRESEEKYRLVTENASIGIGYYDIDGNVILYNRQAANVLKGTPRDFIGRNIREIFPGDAGGEFYFQRIQDVIRTKKRQVFEDLIHVPGGEYWFKSIYSCVLGEKGNVEGIQIISEDITERKTAQLQLETERQRAQTYLDISPAIVLAMDVNAHITLINQRGCQILGGTEADILGKNWIDHFIPESQQANIARVFKEIISGDVDLHRTVDNEIINLNGDILTIRWQNTLMYDQDGIIIGTMGSGEDVTEERKMQERLEISEERYRLAMNATTDGVWDWDVANQRVSYSDSWYRMLGLEIQEGYTSHNVWESRIHPDDKEETLANLISNLETGTPAWEQEHRLRHENGEWRWYVASGEVVQRDGKGKPVRMVGTMKDITTRKEQEARIARSHQILVSLSQASQIIQQADTPDEVYKQVGWVMENLGFRTLIMTLNDDGDRLYVRYQTLGLEIINKLRNLLKITEARPGLCLNKQSYFDLVLKDPRPMFIEDIVPFMKINLGLPIKKLAVDIAGVLGVTRAILTPLYSGEDSRGIMIIIGDNLTEEEIPAIQTFANQAMIAHENAHLIAQIQANQQRLTRLSHTLVQTQENERRQIARELHDEIGQTLTALNISLETLRQHVGSEYVLDKMRFIQDQVQNLTQQVSHLSLELRPPVLDDLGLVPALVSMFKRISSQSNIKVEFTANRFANRRFSPDLEISAYRIIQEAVTNIIRHSGESRAEASLVLEDDQLKICIQDRGVGFDPGLVMVQSDSIGLAGMTERAELVGGTLVFESAPGKGVTIRVNLPLRAADKKEKHVS